MTRHVQFTQNDMFAKSLQYFKKKVRDEVDFFIQVNKNFLHDDIVIIDGRGQACLNYLK